MVLSVRAAVHVPKQHSLAALLEAGGLMMPPCAG